MAKKSGNKSTARRALCVGINDYPGTQNDLAGCVNDALDWKAALERRGYEVDLLVDSQATKAKISKALRQLIESAGSGDRRVFTYSGHGSWLPDSDGDEPDGRDEMLCPHDVASGAYLMDDELAEIFGRKAEGVSLFFVSDSCHSGTVAKFAPIPLAGIAAKQPRARFLPPESFVKDKRLRRQLALAAGLAKSTPQKYPALLLAGCRDLEYSYDASFDGRPNGAFTYFALRELDSDPATPRTWMTAIRKHLPNAVQPQTPRLYGGRAAKDGTMP